MISEFIDKIAAKLAIWALTRLYGPACDDFDPECIACQIGKVVENLKDFLR